MDDRVEISFVKPPCPRYEDGDMVWGKVESHPWWPGQILNKAFAVPSVLNEKIDGHVLVAFFGDDSYGWFDPLELIPFDDHYAEKSKQTKARSFVNAVQEAKNETARRASLGVCCWCRNSIFRPTGVEGFFAVDLVGYAPGGVYSVKQIKKTREGFCALEMLKFLQQMALKPCRILHETLDRIKALARVLAYRSAVFEEFDETYIQAFGPQQENSVNKMKVFDELDNVPCEAVLSKPLGSAESSGVRKRYVSSVKVNDQVNRENYLSNVPVDANSVRDLPSALKPPKKRLKPENVSKAGQSNMNPACLKTYNRLKRQNKLKSLAAEKKPVKSHASDGKGMDTTVSIQLNANPNPFKKLEAPTTTRVAPKVLLMQFPHRSRLPSVSELKARFARFGPLDRSPPRVFWKSSICRVVFKCEADAQMAYQYAISNRSMFGKMKVDYYLEDLDEPSFVLPNSQKENFEEPSSTCGDPPKLKSIATQQLVLQPGANLESSLKKPLGNELSIPSEKLQVNLFSSGDDAGAAEQLMVNSSIQKSEENRSSLAGATISATLSEKAILPVVSLPDSKSNWHEIERFVDSCDLQHCQIETGTNNNICATNQSVDISTPLLNLLGMCRDIVDDIRKSLQKDQAVPRKI